MKRKQLTVVKVLIEVVNGESYSTIGRKHVEFSSEGWRAMIRAFLRENDIKLYKKVTHNGRKILDTAILRKHKKYILNNLCV